MVPCLAYVLASLPFDKLRCSMRPTKRRKYQKTQLTIPYTYEMASRTPLVLRNTCLSLAAGLSTASLQNLVLHVGIVVCPSPDIVFHPEILCKPQIVLGFFRSIHGSRLVVEVR